MSSPFTPEDIEFVSEMLEEMRESQRPDTVEFSNISKAVIFRWDFSEGDDA